MNIDKLSKILKNKGFYLSLLTGVLAIAAICFVCFNTGGSDDNKNLADLNENPISQQAEKDQQDDDGEQANVPEEDQSVVSENATNQKEEESNTDPDLSDKALAANDKKTETAKSKEDSEDAVAANSKASKQSLSFDEDDNLEWPVSGDVIIPYDVEHGVQFLTLGQYKCSDAIVISSKVGTNVKSATKATVLSIDNDDELGLTVTTDIGSGYQVVYGQLKNLKVKVGDTIDTGDVIGEIAEPTKYYVVEGPNLYFKVMEDEESVNPMYLLD